MTQRKAGEVELREVRDSDLPVFFEMQRDKAYDRMAAFTHKDPSNRAAFDAHWAKNRADKTVIMKTIVFEGQVVGSIASWVQSGERQVTYGIAREHWGKGLATDALGKFLVLVKERPLFAGAARDNVASLRVQEKHGFKITGYGKGFANARGEEIEEAFLKLE